MPPVDPDAGVEVAPLGERDHAVHQAADLLGLGLGGLHPLIADDRDREVAEHRLDRSEVLLGENLGRGQQGCLPTGVDDAQHLPVLGRIAAGGPILAEEAVEDGQELEVVRIGLR